MNRRIVIVGFMGSGKTTVARALSERLNCGMIDLDSFITETEGRSPAAIIQHEGEHAFREIETAALRDVLNHSDARVIALGGGAWTIDTNRDLVARHDCLSVWLDVPFDVCWQRITSGENSVRPLAPDFETAHKLYQSRQVSYALVEMAVALKHTHLIDAIVNEILTQT